MEKSGSGDDGKLPTGRLAAHSLLNLPLVSVQLPISVFLPAIYARQYGLSLTVLGAIFLAERVWGTLTDPVVGWLCDKTKSRYGRRKVWIAAGSILYILSCWFLFFPGEGVTPVYLAAALVAVFLSLSMIQIPYYAWSGELSGDYHERTRITSYQTVASGIAMFSVLVLPTFVEQRFPGDDVLKLNAMGLAVIAPVLPVTILALWAFPDHSRHASIAAPRKVGWREAVATILGEKILFKVMFADFLILFAQGVRGALFVFFVSHVAGRPDLASGMFLLQFIFGIVAAPIWQAIARRIGKHRGVIAAEIGQAIVNFGLLLVGKGDIALLVGLTVAQGLMQGSGNLILRAMLADVADEHRLRTGVDRTAFLFSVFSISAKAGSALPVGIALPIIAWYGFDPALPTNPDSALIALALLFAAAPAFAHLLAAWLMRGFAIDEDRQAEIQRRLDAEQQ
ncbi:MAG: MFS transporter [Novosphingobium sp.]|nr:MFS transporter [Novosphingobium sp.]